MGRTQANGWASMNYCLLLLRNSKVLKKARDRPVWTGFWGFHFANFISLRLRWSFGRVNHSL